MKKRDDITKGAPKTDGAQSESNDQTIVPFREGQLEITRKPKTRREYCRTECRRIGMDLEKRRIECKDCHQEVDAFDYLAEWAKRGDQRMTALKDLDERIRVRGNEARAMEREYQNAMRRLDRVDRPARKRVQQALFDAKWNPHHAIQIVPKAEPTSSVGDGSEVR